MQPHISLLESLHLTIFMTSQPGDPRPDPFTVGGGLDPTNPPVPIPAPDAATLQHEVDTCRRIASTGRPVFEVQCSEHPILCLTRFHWLSAASLSASLQVLLMVSIQAHLTCTAVRHGQQCSSYIEDQHILTSASLMTGQAFDCLDQCAAVYCPTSCWHAKLQYA